MNFDYTLLNGKIAEKYKTQREFSRAIGISEHSISRKMNGQVAWKQAEMAQICQLLGIPASEIPLYFFHELVTREREQKGLSAEPFTSDKCLRALREIGRAMEEAGESDIKLLTDIYKFCVDFRRN